MMSTFLIQFLTGLASAATLFMVAVGLSIIFGVSRIVNFAHGSFYMLGAYLAYTLIQRFDGSALGFWSAVIIAALLVGVIGLVVEILILRRIYQAPELFQLLATFGVVLIVQDAALWLWGPEDLIGPRAPGLDGALPIGQGLLPEYDIALIVLSAAVLLGLWLLFHKTRWGTLVRAATQDREMVAALGVNQAWLFSSVFFLGAVLAGLGGAVQLPKGGADLLLDMNIIAAAFVVVVVGGMGSISGAFLAAVLIGELNAFGILVFPQITLVLMFLVMAVVLIIRPWGLLGKPENTVHQHVHEYQEPLRLAGRTAQFGWLVLVLGLVILPWLTPWLIDEFTLVLAIEILIAALFAASLHFMMGPGGMVSFGHAAYFGLGAYGAALLVKYLQAPMLPALLAAPLCGGLGALIFGWFCVRLSGVYLAMLTLAFAQIAWSIVFQWYDFTGGDDGILGIWPAAWAGDRWVYYYLTLALCGSGIYGLRRLIFSPFGYVLRAGRDSPLRAEAVGIPLQRQQWLAFTLAGVCAGLAGGLYVFSKGSIFPDAMAIPRSIDALMMVLLGGVQSLAGPLFGAALYTWLYDTLARLEYWRLLLGSTIVVLVLLFPQGLGGIGQRLMRRSAK